MTTDTTGKFRGSWMFDTHEATYHLDHKNNIVWVQCDQIRDEVIWIQSWNTVWWFIWNPWVFTLTQSLSEDIVDTDTIDEIIQELNRAYTYRILKWLPQEETKHQEAA